MKTEKGLVLEGRYELEHLIATGGMGQVWKGRDQDLDRDVAIKVLREEYAGDEGFLKRFRAEARHTAALSHEAIAALYDYGERDGRAYIVMELCAGRPLSEIIEENPGGLPEDRVLPLLTVLARALDAAHAKGVVHRDVKPENILVDQDNDWAMKITDFGIARSKDQARLTVTGLVMGTAQYLSPEQAMGKQATSLSDIYALGIVAFEMLVGHRPFTGSTQVEIAMAQVKQPPPELPERISLGLRQLIQALLAKAPANRPRSAASVARTLEALQRGEQAHVSTGTIPSDSSNEYFASAGDRPSASSAASSSSANGAEGSPSAPSASPTGTRTAAMPLPRSSRQRGIRHRSSASAASAASAPSPSPQDSRWRIADSSADAAGVKPAAPGSAPVSADHPDRRVHGTTTGRRVGAFTLPGIVLGLLLLAVVVFAVLAGTGVVTIGADPAMPVPATTVTLSDAVTGPSTMIGSADAATATRTEAL